MKKTFLLLMSVAMFIMMPFTAFAGKYEHQVLTEAHITYLDDGSYYTTVIETENFLTSSAYSTNSTSYVSKTKYTIYSNSDGVALWKFTVKGSFKYDGTTSQCTSASSSVDIYDNSWYIYSKSASASGNKAIGNVTMKRKVLGLVTSTKSTSLTLTCDKNGNFS